MEAARDAGRLIKGRFRTDSTPDVKVGRLVRYRESDLVAFIAANTVAPQSLVKE